jgi:hypothetical protein
MNANDKGRLIMVTGSIALGAVITGAVLGSLYSSSRNKAENLQRQADYWKDSAEYYQYQLRQAEAVADQLSATITVLESDIYDLQGDFIELANRPPVYVQVPVYADLKEFQTLVHLKEWVAAWNMFRPGFPEILMGPRPYDCDDFSMQMVLDAAKDGYVLGWFVDVARRHMMVAATIGNKFYIIEPQDNEVYSTYDGLEWLVDVPERYYRPPIE